MSGLGVDGCPGGRQKFSGVVISGPILFGVQALAQYCGETGGSCERQQVVVIRPLVMMTHYPVSQLAKHRPTLQVSYR